MTRIVWTPNPGPQTAFLAGDDREILYGGAAGGGKSDAIVVQPTRFIGNPNFSGIVMRRTRRELQEIIDRMAAVYPAIAPGAVWNEQRLRWSFPSGAFIHVGFAEHEDDILNYKSDEFQYVAFDETTTFSRRMYLYMFSRNRSRDKDLPTWLRGATNPGDIGHEWVYERFVKEKVPYASYLQVVTLPQGEVVESSRKFIPATAYDNPRINRVEYIAGMMEMPESLRDALIFGKWDVFEGQFFRKLPKEVPARLLSSEYYMIRCMDYGLVDATAVYWIVVYPQLQKLHIVAELWLTEMNIQSLAHMIMSREVRLMADDQINVKPRLRLLDPACFTRESSMQTIATLLSQHGAYFDKANNDRPAGWAMLRYVLESDKLEVWQGRAPQLLRTMPTLIYHPIKKNDLKPGGQDHGVDALRYGTLAWYEQPVPPPVVPLMDPSIQDTTFPRLTVHLQKQHNAGRFDFLGEGW